jgi:hypothetical protein
MWKGKKIEPTKENLNRADLDYTGSVMPPREAVAGTYKDRDGKLIKVEDLADEDRLTIVRWIDLGCPLDLDYALNRTSGKGLGWMCDDQRPVLTVTQPQPGANTSVTRFLIGMWDINSGLDADTFSVKADFTVNGLKAGTELASQFKPINQGIWELKLATPLDPIENGELSVKIRDNQGNQTKVQRVFSVGKH